MERDAIYKCEICGNVVSGVIAHAPDIMCCGQVMTKLDEKTAEKEGKEKHVPVIQIDGKKVTVSVGSIPHPMEEKHHIALIQIMKDGYVIAGARLSPGEEPQATFELEDTEGIQAREYCNLHGLWKS